MPRGPRRVSSSGYHHVTLRGDGRQTLFENDGDRRAFLDMLDRQLARHGLQLIAWCLMGNHVHLLLLDEGGHLSEAMHDLMTSYALRFNRRTGHVGHVFEGRFGSEPVESEAYLLEVVRYIHDNPVRAGLGARGEYPWSSYREYVGAAGRTDTGLVLEMVGGVDRFVEFSEERGAPYRFARRRRVPDDDASEVARSALEGVEPAAVRGLPRDERNRRLRALRSTGLSVRQVERLTGIGRWTITEATK